MAVGLQATGTDRIHAPAGGSLAADLIGDPAAAEAVWRRMESDSGNLQTPYQRYDWTMAFLQARGLMSDARILVLRDGEGRARILLPLVLERRLGLCIARTVGGTHANYHLPLFAGRDAAAMDAGDVIAALIRAGRLAGIDVYALHHQPRSWDGAANPFAASGEPEASNGYGLTLETDPEATLRRVFSADARKKLRSKEKRLIEAQGPVAYRRAETGDDVAHFLAAFYAHKANRFAAMGVADPYADPSIRAFLTAAASGPDPAVEIHALYIVESGRVLATFGGAVTGRRYSGMMTAFDPDPEIARYSPGDLLLQHLVREQAARGRLGFDLGVGEARYKASICNEIIELVEAVIPVSLAGRTYGALRQGVVRAKRSIKRDPRLYTAFQRLRKLRRG
ncbi:GNAT family N-acetyltransferase [Methylobacterium sp. E-005]|uniref:GNAT family N-acetyltransferase n=1 Tax=Methylobacterium sp. E-005 TaxID=2836549 RepID=UPI001FBB7A5E|nr:GNAT family N-acetyltransferase [Methylobacterium sp. E-005]MCJ2085618.1 GNAT family N-acetyltransferase [Methylobacterium sp. E-005]